MNLPNKVDWSRLLTNNRIGLVVEGKTDQFVIETFLNMGENTNLWRDWRSQLAVAEVGGKNKIFDELGRDDYLIWGLIDRDAYSSTQIDNLQAKYPRLLVLPRWTIENYFIDPNELSQLIPQTSKRIDIQNELDKHKGEWLKYGALWHVLTEIGAFGDKRPNPIALCKIPMPNETEMRSQLTFWNEQLNPDNILTAYAGYQQTFLDNSTQNYTHHIHGKKFFPEIVHPILNRIQQKSENAWKEELLKRLTDCPADIVPILRRVVG